MVGMHKVKLFIIHGVMAKMAEQMIIVMAVRLFGIKEDTITVKNYQF